MIRPLVPSLEEFISVDRKPQKNNAESKISCRENKEKACLLSKSITVRIRTDNANGVRLKISPLSMKNKPLPIVYGMANTATRNKAPFKLLVKFSAKTKKRGKQKKKKNPFKDRMCEYGAKQTLILNGFYLHYPALLRRKKR